MTRSYNSGEIGTRRRLNPDLRIEKGPILSPAHVYFLLPATAQPRNFNSFRAMKACAEQFERLRMRNIPSLLLRNQKAKN